MRQKRTDLIVMRQDRTDYRTLSLIAAASDAFERLSLILIGQIPLQCRNSFSAIGVWRAG